MGEAFREFALPFLRHSEQRGDVFPVPATAVGEAG
jgi:hypothetical protein